mmetsp:Transcript_5432/g.7983  ORF Transcript_5432/g.7983 Transcript_5432/m.7983 type:complete len:227 (-) Transcript_5432:121-801(-)
MHAHNAIRGELADIKMALKKCEEREDLPEWAVVAIQQVWKDHSEHVHAHHENEDELFVPFLETRIKLPEKLEMDHKEIIQDMSEIDGIIKGLKPGDASMMKSLVESFTKYEVRMLPHLTEEEGSGLVLMRAYFTPKEIAPIVQKIVAKGPPVEMGSIIHYMGGKKQMMEGFMPQEGIPFFVWYLEFSGRLKYFENNFLKCVEALKTGEAPNTEKIGWFAWFVSFIW